MAGYEILIDNSKKDDILRIEGSCPCCDYYPSRYVETKKILGHRDYRQFKYTCPRCNSIWVGNIYDNNLNMVSETGKTSILRLMRGTTNEW